MGFPMEMNRFPGKIWVVAHKPVAVAAGLGHMGIHRNVIHPKFGNFILLDRFSGAGPPCRPSTPGSGPFSPEVFLSGPATGR